jgi:hypothetical protein
MSIRRLTGRALALVSLGVVAAFVVVTEHWGHALGLLPYLILLACPALHLVSHDGHGRAHRRLARSPAPSTVNPARGGAP